MLFLTDASASALEGLSISSVSVCFSLTGLRKHFPHRLWDAMWLLHWGLSLLCYPRNIQHRAETQESENMWLWNCKGLLCCHCVKVTLNQIQWCGLTHCFWLPLGSISPLIYIKGSAVNCGILLPKYTFWVCFSLVESLGKLPLWTFLTYSVWGKARCINYYSLYS
jgi:hypothetical protein